MGLMLQTPNNVITKKTLGDRAYMCTAPELWNSLPVTCATRPILANLKFYGRLTVLV